MRKRFPALRIAAYLLVAIGFPATVTRAQVPIDGYLPFVGIGLTDEFNDDFITFPEASSSPAGATLLGSSSTPFFDVALLDTGAGFTLLTDRAFDDFGLGLSRPGEPDGFRGTETVPIGGATGTLTAAINDPLGLYASGLQDRVSAGAQLTMDTNSLPGQTNTSTITFPPDSPLPNVVGLPFASQYATHIRSDQPQVFQLGGRTLRTPAVSFEPLGSGGGSIVRKAPLQLNPGTAFQQPPAYLPNIINFDINNPQEDPILPTVTQGALFLNVNASNDGIDLNAQEFFFDTGASVTVVSTLKALQLGFDVLIDEPDFTIAVTGSGGTEEGVPGFFVDEIEIVALGGSISATDVPVIVLDVPDPSDPVNLVDGIVGTNLLAGRNVVIDPNSPLNGGPSAGVYISDPITNDFRWTTASSVAAWDAAGSWDAAAKPDLLSVASVRNAAPISQEARVAGEQEAWDVVVAGDSPSATMTLRVMPGGTLTTFSGTTVLQNGELRLSSGDVDTQYLDIRGGRLTGEGTVFTGSGPIIGQVESNDGVVAPGDGVGLLTIDGRFNNRGVGVVEIELSPTGGDVLEVLGEASLGGVLSVELVDGLLPSVGDSFNVLTYESRSGEFDSVLLPTGFEWGVDYLSDRLRLTVLAAALEGDFNADGVVDAADYTAWRDGVIVANTPANYAAWRSNYGMSNNPPSSSVPEPTALLIVGGVALLTAGRRTRRSTPRR